MIHDIDLMLSCMLCMWLVGEWSHVCGCPGTAFHADDGIEDSMSSGSRGGRWAVQESMAEAEGLHW